MRLSGPSTWAPPSAQRRGAPRDTPDCLRTARASLRAPIPNHAGYAATPSNTTRRRSALTPRARLLRPSAYSRHQPHSQPTMSFAEMQGSTMPQHKTFAHSKEDILGALSFYFGQPVSPEKLKDYNEHHAATRKHQPQTNPHFARSPKQLACKLNTDKHGCVCARSSFSGCAHARACEPSTRRSKRAPPLTPTPFCLAQTPTSARTRSSATRLTTSSRSRPRRGTRYASLVAASHAPGCAPARLSRACCWHRCFADRRTSVPPYRGHRTPPPTLPRAPPVHVRSHAPHARARNLCGLQVVEWDEYAAIHGLHKETNVCESTLGHR